MKNDATKVSDVMAFAVGQADLFEILMDAELEKLGLDDERRGACEAAREHIKSQIAALLQACGEATAEQMKDNLLTKTVTKRYAAAAERRWLYLELKGGVWLGFFLPTQNKHELPGDFFEKLAEVSGRTVDSSAVPLVVTLAANSKKDESRRQIVEKTGRTVCTHIYHPRVIWRVLEIRQGQSLAQLAQSAVEGLAEACKWIAPEASLPGPDSGERVTT